MRFDTDVGDAKSMTEVSISVAPVMTPRSKLISRSASITRLRG
jgi:hypothetical protein